VTAEPRTGIAIADLYLARGRIRAELNMQGFSRLSDLFNNAPSDFIGATMRMAAAAPSGNGNGQPELTFERRELVVRLSDVRLVRPIEENPSVPSPTEWRERLPARVVLDIDDWQVSGDIYLVDRIRWLDFMTAARNRFISVSNASVRFVGVAEPLECAYLLVNGARVSALYEAP
jgi:hypothetical protein